MKLIHEDIVTDNQANFIEKVKIISKALSIDANWLMQIMYSESRINPKAVNPFSEAVGLIQFMPSTAQSLGTATDELLLMSNLAQLDFVYKYLRPFAGKINSYIDLYFSIFFPLAINKPLEWIFQAKNLAASLVAQQNPAFDLNHDGVLTVAEVQEAMLNFIPKDWKLFFKKKV
jgi:membrane-bound lytic murein transglycosylase MltF